MNKNYVVDEYQRNVAAISLYEDLLKAAFGKDVVVIISHHISVRMPDKTVHEIPSADTILFDHEIMGKVFGPWAKQVMTNLALVPPHQREDRLRYWQSHHAGAVSMVVP